MSTNKIDKEGLELYLKELAKILKKKSGGDASCEIVIVGGASIVLNYSFRLSTMDIDCTDNSGILMNDVIGEIAKKYNLPSNWINTDFIKTKSYSKKLNLYSQFYKSFSNGTLNVRTIKDEYLIAMKLVSARKYKNDYSDIYGIVNELRKNKKEITIEQVENAAINLYGSLDCVNKEAYRFLKSILSDSGVELYDSIRKQEEKNLNEIKQVNDKNINDDDINYILDAINNLWFEYTDQLVPFWNMIKINNAIIQFRKSNVRKTHFP